MPGKKRPRGPGEGSIRERPDGRWEARFRVEGGRQISLYGRTYAEARDKLITALDDRREGTLVTAPSQTLAQYLDAWLAIVAAANVRATTLANYSRLVRLHIVPALGSTRLDRLTPQLLQAHYRRLVAEGLAPSSVGRVHSLLHTALHQAVRWSLVARNVCDLVDPPRVPRQEQRALSADECRRLLDAARPDRFHALYVLTVATGLRQSELLGLRWSDLDTERGTLAVGRQLVWLKGQGLVFTEPKSEKGRRVLALPTFALTALAEHRERQQLEREFAGDAWHEQGLVFPNQRGGPVERGNLNRRSWAVILARAGVGAVRFHDLRHTHASLLLSAGVGVRVVQERLGHSDVSLTLGTYGHVARGADAAAAETLDHILGL